MARELGLNPHKFGKIANENQGTWQIPLPQFIEAIYFKRFHKSQPDVVQSIEGFIHAQQEKKAEKKARKVMSTDSPSGDDSDMSINNVKNEQPISKSIYFLVVYFFTSVNFLVWMQSL